MNAIQISNVAIRQNANGLFSLNDLHKAAGGQSKYQASNFMRLQQTQDLIIEIENSSNLMSLAVEKTEGRNGGTYVCKELVIAYGMWINASFALKVIQCFLNTQEQSPKLTPAQKQQIQEAVRARHHRTGEHWQEIYRKLHAYLKINSYHEIQAKDFQTALNFLASIENAPERFTEPSNALDDKTILSMAQTLLYAQDMRRFINRYYLAFSDLGLERNGALHGFIHKTEPSFAAVRRYIEKEGMRLIQENTHKAQAAWLLQHIQQTAGIPYSL